MQNLKTSFTPDIRQETAGRPASLISVRLTAVVIACWMIFSHWCVVSGNGGVELAGDAQGIFGRFLGATVFSEVLLLLPAAGVCLLAPGTMGRWLGRGPEVMRGLCAIPLFYLFLALGCEAILLPVPTPDEQDLLTLFRMFTPIQQAAAAFLVCGLVPLAEELFFRGVLGGRTVAGILLSAALFAFAHGTAGFLLPLFFFGVVQGLLCRRYGSLLPSVGLHALFNGVTLLLL